MRWKICGVLALSLSLGLSACQALEAGLVREETWQRVVLEDGEEAAEETAGADEYGEEAGGGSATPGGESAQPGGETAQAGGETAQSGDFYDRQLRPETREICRTYFKAGDYRRQMTIVPGGRQDRNRVTVNLYRQDGQGMGKNLEHQMDFWYEDGVSRYSTPVGGPDGVLDANSPSASAIFQEDGGVALYSAAMEEAEGVYYPEEDLLWAEAFERPLNRADTAGMSQGTLRLLRNQYYAVYGRKFDDPQLAEYFSGQPWYRPAVEAADFSDDWLPVLFRRNISFIKEQEETCDEMAAASWEAEWEKLAAAPYLHILPESGEYQVDFSSRPETAVDRGIYWETVGRISLPLTLTPEEYETVMKENGTVEIVVDELTGETEQVRRSGNYNYGECMLLAPGETEETANYCYLTYRALEGDYFLWRDSADTVFKPVYEGPIFVLKGAEMEWYNYFAMIQEKVSEEGGDRREIQFDGSVGNYYGNVPYFDEKGYLKGLYYFGD